MFRGDFDASGAEDIKEELESLCEDGRSENILFDMSEVLYMSSFGIKEILICVKMIEKHGGRYCFWGFNDNVRRVIEKTGLTDILNIADSKENAKNKTAG